MNDCEHKTLDSPLCDQCAGSGEGMHPDTRCRKCNGSGEYGLVCEDCGEPVDNIVDDRGE